MVKQVNPDGGKAYTYDKTGRQPDLHQTFDADREASRRENRLVSVTVGGQTTQFVYDGDGNLVKKIKPDGSKRQFTLRLCSGQA